MEDWYSRSMVCCKFGWQECYTTENMWKIATIINWKKKIAKLLDVHNSEWEPTRHILTCDVKQNRRERELEGKREASSFSHKTTSENIFSAQSNVGLFGAIWLVVF